MNRNHRSRSPRATPTPRHERRFSDVPIVDDLSLAETFDSLMIGAIRDASMWPKPHRDLAREALSAFPADCFEPWIAEQVN